MSGLNAEEIKKQIDLEGLVNNLPRSILWYRKKTINDVFIKRIIDCFADRTEKIPENSQKYAINLMKILVEQILYMHWHKARNRFFYRNWQNILVIATFLSTISIAFAAAKFSALGLTAHAWNVAGVISSAATTALVLISRTGNSRSLWIIGTEYLHRFCVFALKFNDELLDLEKEQLIASISEQKPPPSRAELERRAEAKAIDEIALLRRDFNTLDNEFRKAMHQSNADSAQPLDTNDSNSD